LLDTSHVSFWSPVVLVASTKSGVSLVGSCELLNTARTIAARRPSQYSVLLAAPLPANDSAAAAANTAAAQLQRELLGHAMLWWCRGA